MQHIYKLAAIENKGSKPTFTFCGSVVSLFIYTMLCLLQVLPTEQVGAQTGNLLDYNIALKDSISVAAYSVRKLSSTYTGPAMMVRRSSDDAIAKVYFDGSNVVSSSSIDSMQSNITLSNVSSFPIKTGKIFYTVSSNIVTGYGTRFDLLSVGDMLVDIAYQKTIGIIIQIISPTSLKLNTVGCANVPNNIASYRVFGAAPCSPFSTFYGSSSCYINTWYDQSGNGAIGVKDVVQATPSMQPRLVNAGAFELNGSKPAIYFNSTASQNLVSNFTGIIASYPVTISLLANTLGNPTQGPFIKYGSNGGSQGIAIGINSPLSTGSYLTGKSLFVVRTGGSNPNSLASPDVNYPSTQFTSTTIQQLNSTRNFLNGSNIPLANFNGVPDGTFVSGKLSLASVGGTSNFATVKESEVIIFNSALSRTARRGLECEQMVYYSILTASVGATQNVCNGLISAPLGGNTPYAYFGITGRWSQQSGPGTSTFSNLTNGAATATASIAGAYIYRWTVSNGNCEKYADIAINYSSPASTAVDQNICGSLVSDPLGGNIPNIGTGQWSMVSTFPFGAVPTFSDINSASATVSVNVYGSYTFRWTITGGTCGTGTADINVTFSPSTNPPPTATISGNTSICPGGTANLSVALTGTGPWNLSYTDGTTIISQEGITSSPYPIIVSPSQTATYKITSLSDAYCKAQLSNLTGTVMVSVAPKVTITPDYCTAGGGKVILSADAHAGGYLWSNGVSGSQSISVTQSGFYSVTVRDVAGGCTATTSFSLGEELIYNGNFELGNVVPPAYKGFNTEYILPTAARGACPGATTGGLYAAGTYDIVTDPQVDHCKFWGKDHTTGTGKFMAINGATNTPPLTIWQSNSIPVKKGTTYYFSAWALSLNSTGPFAALQFLIGDNQAGTIATLSAGVDGPSSANNGWRQFYGSWIADTTNITISIVNTNIIFAGNDFGLDDISFSTMPPVGLNVTAAAIGGPSFNTCDAIDLVPTVVGGWSPLSYIWTYASGTSTVDKPTISLMSPADNNISLKVTDAKNCFVSTTVNLTINDVNRTWLGINTNWYDPQNWCGGVPNSAKDVLIPKISAGIYPIINSGTAAVKNITINNGASVTVNTAVLQVAAAVTNSGLLDVTAGTVEFNGSSPQTISGSWFKGNSINNLIATNTTGITLSNINADSLNILDSLSFGAGNVTLNTGDNLILTSTVNSTARVADITHNGSYLNNKIIGKVTVQRYYPALRAWRLVTSPLSNTGSIFSNWQNGGLNVPGKGVLITGPTPTSGNGLDPSGNNSSSLKYGVGLAPVLDTKTMNLSKNTTDTANIGYFLFVRGDRDPNNTNPANSNNTTISSKGFLQTGRQSFRASDTANGFALIGNPYASPVDFSSLTRDSIVNKFWVWDPKLSAVGAYVVVDDYLNTGTYAIVPGIPGSPGGQTKIIQSSQAFFIQTSANNPNASIVFNENNKATVNNLKIFRPAPGRILPQSLRINLYQVNYGKPNILVDGILAQFYAQGNPGVDIADALKFTNVNETVSFLRNTRSLAIERRPLITSNDTLYLKLARATPRSYHFQFEPGNLDPSLSAYLEDSFTGVKTALSVAAPSVYDFSINGDAASSATNRFKIVFKKVTSAPLPVTFKTVKAYQQATNIAIDWKVENEINIKHYEVEKSADGASFVKVNVTTATGANRTSTSYSWLDESPLDGNNFYRVRSVGSDGNFAYSNVVLVKIGKTTAGIRIYPNPVQDGIISAEFKNMAAGVYNVKLINSLGQTIFTKIISHAPGTSMENIKSEYKLVAGIYQLKVTAPDQEITTVKVIVK